VDKVAKDRLPNQTGSYALEETTPGGAVEVRPLVFIREELVLKVAVDPAVDRWLVGNDVK
jgi:hypothetical protein